MSRFYSIHSCAPPKMGGGSLPRPGRSGMTLVEILIAVTLMTVIMLAVVQILSGVSKTLNVNQNAMIIAGRARETQLQIEKDLSCVTAPLTPPLRFADDQGYFCIIEGLGSYYRHLYHKDAGNNWVIGWDLEDIAANENGGPDSSVGDCDDIIMFTARAPGDSMYRGLVGGKMVESKEAEICYFLRGTTLYRRVLLIIPDEQLQAALDANANYSSGNFPASDGYGFYRDFDVSARLEWDADTNQWRIRANTLADLTRRENRFGHSALGRNLSLKLSNGTPFLPFPYGVHNNAAWYQLRLPTLAECTLKDGGSWRLGTQIVTKDSQYNMLLSNLTYNGGVDDDWNNNAVNTFPKGAEQPYIDYWDNPLPWANIDAQTKALATTSGIYDTASTSDFVFDRRISEDVLLNNVISFDVKVWAQDNRTWNNGDWQQLPPAFIDLGQYRNSLIPANAADAQEISRYLGFQGFYGVGTGNSCYANTGSDCVYAPLPAVYDTWTDAYENDATGVAYNTSNHPVPGLGAVSDYADIMEHVDQWVYPPPYTVPLTGIQIKVRVFDPGTNNIREVTIRRSFN